MLYARGWVALVFLALAAAAVSTSHSDAAFTYTTLDDPSAGPGQTFVYGISGSTLVGTYADSGIPRAGDHGFSETGGVYITLDNPSAVRKAPRPASY